MVLDRELVARVRDATDLVALVGQVVQLRKQGGAWVGRCPFHTEKTPSFQVVPDRGFYHCFGCGKNGDALSWLQEREGLTFNEALEQLARAAGIDLPRHRPRSSAEIDLETRLRSALDAAQSFYQRRLQETSLARNYLDQRGIAPNFIQEAGFGYAPEGHDGLLAHLRNQGFSSDLLEQAGLVGRNERGNLFDFLRHRLTIPIHDARGRLLAFGGRAFGDGKPKYLNTRETSLFDKGSVLFGFHRAKGHMRDGALVVEGYFDVLQLHQEGVHQAVAPMGTALTEAHLNLIGRFTKRLVLCFDGDAAGLRAMEKGLRMALPAGFDVRLLMLPSGEDPDTWCLKVGSEGFKDLVRTAPDWTNFVINRALEGKDFLRIPDRMGALRELAEFLVHLPSTPERRELFASLAHQLQIPLVEFDLALKHRTVAPAPEVAMPSTPVTVEVDELLKPLLIAANDPAVRSRLAALPSAWWDGLDGCPLVQAVLDADGDLHSLPEPVLAQIRSIEATWAPHNEAEKVPERAFQKLEMAYVLRELQTLGRQVMDPAVASSADLLRHLEQRQAELLKRKSQLTRRQRVERTGLD